MLQGTLLNSVLWLLHVDMGLSKPVPNLIRRYLKHVNTTPPRKEAVSVSERH